MPLLLVISAVPQVVLGHNSRKVMTKKHNEMEGTLLGGNINVFVAPALSA